MSRLSIETPGRAETVVEGLYRDVERRISASPPGLCPVDMALSFLRLSHAQTCGKCVPCRIGLGQLTELLESVLDSTATPETIDLIEKTARVIQDTADCAIGYEAARMVLQGVQGFRDDYMSHVEHGRCLFGWNHPVPCVALCPAGVDIPGYIALVRAGRYNDAVRLIRKDNPFPTVCGYVCEHPCEARCRRSMVDDAVNICGIKRFACDHATDMTPPPCAPSTGKRIAVIGGGPGGLSAAYFLSLMGHRVVVYDQRPQLGGMLRYGIPDYRLPQEKLDRDIEFILSTGIEVLIPRSAVILSSPRSKTSMTRFTSPSAHITTRRSASMEKTVSAFMRRCSCCATSARAACPISTESASASSAAAMSRWTRPVLRCVSVRRLSPVSTADASRI